MPCDMELAACHSVRTGYVCYILVRLRTAFSRRFIPYVLSCAVRFVTFFPSETAFFNLTAPSHAHDIVQVLGFDATRCLCLFGQSVASVWRPLAVPGCNASSIATQL